MNTTEKEISYNSTNSYTTLNSLTNTTKYVWFVCHGMGYLSKYFIKYFEDLNPENHYIIAPQAQSKYYIAPKFKHVGASWLTKENTIKETKNVMSYFDKVLEYEKLPSDVRLIVLGYSQGVSVALRYIASRTLKCNQVILMSGGIPKELEATDFSFLNAKISFIYGTQDEYLNEERILYETNRAKELFHNQLAITSFEGKHEMKKDLLNTLI